ncbi:MAG: winged helix-turn-helix transcriptional regulator [Promethearchaeota archaeon]
MGKEREEPGQATGIENSIAIAREIPTKLTAVEKKVRDIAKNLMKRRHVLDRMSLYSACFEHLKDSELNNLDSIILGLFKKRVLVQKRALTREEVLENENRQKIITMLEKHPGLTCSKISKILRINYGTIKWHLRMLDEFNLVRLMKIGNSIAYYLSRANKEDDIPFFVMNKSRVVEIVQIIHDHPGINFVELFDRIDIERVTLLRKIRDLVSVRLVIEEKDVTGNACYAINEALSRITSHALLSREAGMRQVP